MRCPKCQTQVEATDRFCLSCGAALTRPAEVRLEAAARPSLTCRRCGVQLREKDVFCGSCGTPALTEAPARPGSSRAEPPPSTAKQTPATSPAKEGRLPRLTIFLSYLNIVLCAIVMTYAYLLLVTARANYESPYFPLRVARYAMLALTAGLFLFGLRLWPVKNPVARRHARIIFVLSLLIIGAGLVLFV